MKKSTLTILICAQACFCLADWKLPQAYTEYSQKRRYCVSRDTATLKGFVITTWFRDGRPDWILPSVETNAVKNIQGKEQNNPLQNELEKSAQKVNELWGAYTNQLAQTTAYSNAYVIAEGVANAATAKIQDEIADLQAKVEKYTEYQTKYPLLKAVWTAMINDAQNRIKILQALTGGAS